MKDEAVVFESIVPGEVRGTRRLKALATLRDMLASAAPDALALQVECVQDARAEADNPWKRKLGYLASESILDRFAGKATQQVEVAQVEPRPITFSGKLANLAPVAVAVARRPEGESALQAALVAAARLDDDPEGVGL